MNTGKLIFRNTASSTAGKVLGDLCTFFFLVYFARKFGMDILGKYAFAMSVGGFLTVFVSVGLNTLMVRDISQNKQMTHKYIANLMVTQGIMALVVWVLIVLMGMVLPLSQDTRTIIVIIGTYHVFYKLTMLFRSEFRAHEDMHYSAILEFYHKGVILILGVAAIVIWKDAVIVLAVYPISAFSMFLMAFWISVWRYGWPADKVEFGFIKSLLTRALPFLAILILGEFYTRSGVILLTLFEGESAAGIYAAGDRLLVTVAAGIYMFGGAILPTMSRLSEGEKKALLKLFERAIRLMIVAVLPLCTLLFIASEPIILIVFGKQYAESVAVLSIRSWSLLFVGLNLVLSGFLIVHHRQRQWVKLQAFTFVGYGVACIVLIPAFSYIGLACLRLVTEVILFAAAYLYVKRTIHSLPMVKMGTGPVLSCAMSVLIFYLMSDFSLWMSIPSATIACIFGMFLFKGIHIHDFRFAWRVLLSKESTAVEAEMASE